MTDSLPASPPSDAPPDLAAAWPLVRRWSASDDATRSNALEHATAEELGSLIESGRPLLASINAYLDATGDAEHALPYGDFAQAVMEAEFELEGRA